MIELAYSLGVSLNWGLLVDILRNYRAIIAQSEIKLFARLFQFLNLNYAIICAVISKIIAQLRGYSDKIKLSQSGFYSFSHTEKKGHIMLSSTRVAKLTNRQKDVLRLMASGFEDAEIAKRLMMQSRHVTGTVTDICYVLGCRNRIEAVLIFIGLPVGIDGSFNNQSAAAAQHNRPPWSPTA